MDRIKPAYRYQGRGHQKPADRNLRHQQHIAEGNPPSRPLASEPQIQI